MQGFSMHGQVDQWGNWSKDRSSVDGTCTPRQGCPSLVAGRNLLGFLQAIPSIKVLQEVEERLLLALEAHGRVLAPGPQHLRRHARGGQRLGKVVALERCTKPVCTLREGFERAGGRVAAVAPGVRHALKAQLLPRLEDGVAKRARLGRLRVSAAKDLPAEIGPRELLRVPLNLVEVDARSWCGKLRPHAHVEAVDDVNVIHLATVEAAAKLEHVNVLRQLSPPWLQFCG
mmetsp:Transcript_143419/g.445853  ORF Transcript_143419/g.445853 Transcript_143419/m.445853 type:complete len:230 (-) Transcript_143419:609-1298(-)